MFLIVAYIIIHDSFGANAIAVSFEVVLRNPIAVSYGVIAVYGKTELLGRSIPDEETSPWVQDQGNRVVFFVVDIDIFF